MPAEDRGGSTGLVAIENVQRAERALAHRGERLTFRRLDRALGWYWEFSQRMQAPMSPRMRQDHGVDCGPGGDPAEVLCTLSTIGTALHRLQLAEPVRHGILIAIRRDGVSLREISKRAKMDRRQASAELGRAEQYLVGWLQHAEVLV